LEVTVSIHDSTIGRNKVDHPTELVEVLETADTAAGG